MFTGYQYFVYFHTKRLRLAEAIFILYSYCGNDVIAWCFTSTQHHNSSTCMRDLACNRCPASIGTSEWDPGLYAGLGFYPKFYGRCDLYDFSVVVLFWMLSLQIERSGHFSADFLFSSGIKSDNFLTLLFGHVLSRVSNVNYIFKLIELHMCSVFFTCVYCNLLLWAPVRAGLYIVLMTAQHDTQCC